MAITFEDEEKHSPAPAILGVIVLLATFGAGGYFGVRYLMSRQQAIVPLQSTAVQLNKEVLSDPRLDSLELLPDIELGEETVGRDNPFALPQSLTKSQTKTNGGASAGNGTSTSTNTNANAKASANISVSDQSPVTPGTLPQVISNPN